ncbi:tetratricopeptide repeat protein [Bdellovibrio svalbardensis]|uniref:Tetratricopeptide repeat protein n=1 Tax=Bdellovibrio svalbardensis TaxID=2972972 RepID=A0ABT6DEA8_9BACT|nr:tetratricopeptide repeat protein [Bdellovibrio svalbardensis]MDG0814817.1 tetratricopeptide repeat protein [Bdellovibrio svalbardensis]
MTKRLIVFFFTLILPSLLWAQNATFAEYFKQGTQFYSAKEYEKARDAFAKAVETDPHNATALTNLALAQFQLGKKPLAIGLLRKALASDPELTTARAGLKYAQSQMEIKDVPHQIETYESVRSKLLAPVPLLAYLILTALLLFAAGWVLLSYLGRRRTALHEEKSPPPTPVIGLLFSLGFIVSLTLLCLKIYDSSILRATVIEEKVSLQTAPGENQAAILDLYGGMEVVVKTLDKDWAQVTYPGSLTGWIKSSSVIITSGQ